jgi:hypothetical protein
MLALARTEGLRYVELTTDPDNPRCWSGAHAGAAEQPSRPVYRS